MLLPGTKSIHTFGMGFAIDALFLDSQGQAIHLIEKMNGSRVSPLVMRSTMVIEVPAGVLARTGTELGDYIEVIEGDAAMTLDERNRSTSAGTQ